MGLAIAKSIEAHDRNKKLLDRVEYRLIETDFQKEEIYRLRYRAYLREGAIEPRVDGRVTDRFDDMRNSWIFAIHVDGMLASSLRISVASPEHSETPAVMAFPDLLEHEIADGKTIVDPNRFVADAFQARRVPELPYLTLRLAYMACTYFNADIGTATVRKEHQAFYRRVFLHEPRCEPRPYESLIKPLGLMTVDFPKLRDRVFARYPLFESDFLERRKLFERKPRTSPFDLAAAEPALGALAAREFPFIRTAIAAH